MAKVGINTGSAANAGDGSALRAGANIINANFDEIYEYFGDGTTLDADLAGKWLAVATGINTLSNIGIGTTNPWNALTVLGNASITGVTTSSGGFSGDITGSLTGDVYNTGISTFQDVLVSGASTITGKSTFTGIGTFSSDLYVGGNLYTLGDVTYDEVNGRNISVTGIGTVAYLGVTDLNVSGFSTFSGLSTTGSDLYIGDSLYVSQDATILGVTTSSGGVVLPDSVELKFGNLSGGDAKIYHTGTDTKFSNSTGQLEVISDDLEIRSSTGVQTYIKGVSRAGSSAGAYVEIHGDVDFKTGIATFSQDATFVGAASSNTTWDKDANSLKFDDHVKAQFGDGQDLSIYWTGSRAKINSLNSNLDIESDYTALKNQANNKEYITCTNGDSVDLFWSGASNGKRFETTQGGTLTTGIATATGVINSQTDVQINGVSVQTTALNDAVAMAIALG